MPTLPGPPRIPSLIPPAPPIMTELTDGHGDTERPPPSARPSSPPSSRRSVPPALFGVVAAAMMPACSLATRTEPPPAALGAPLTLAQLDITEGSVQQGAPGRLQISQPKVRAVANVETGDAAELRFTYRGPTTVEVPLDGGEMRRQLGLKLRAQDGCNLVYVMWELAPVAKLVVRIKRNPSMQTSEQCGTSGYTTVAPEWSADAPPLRPGSAHTLLASIEDGVLFVRVDGKVVWQGEPGADALALHGPVGVRTDNVELDHVELVPVGRQTLTSRSPGSSR